MAKKYNSAQAIKQNSALPLYFFLLIATRLLFVVMMLLNAFHKQTLTSELYKQYTHYSVQLYSQEVGVLEKHICCSLQGIYGTRA